jgi:AcrR family transcriptional regulator
MSVTHAPLRSTGLAVETARAYDAEARKLRAERILDAAAELLLRWGYKRLTMDDVADHVGIGKGTIYLHWKTREALFEAVLERELAALLRDLEAAVRRDPENALPHALGRLYFQSIMARPLLRAFFTLDLKLLGKLAHSQQMRTVPIDQMRVEYIRLLTEHGFVRPDLPPEDLAYAMRTIIVGFFLAEPVFDDVDQPSVERKGELLELTLQRTFGLSRRPSREAVQAIADHVRRMFAEVLENVAQASR